MKICILITILSLRLYLSLCGAKNFLFYSLPFTKCRTIVFQIPIDPFNESSLCISYFQGNQAAILMLMLPQI
jgi:hypothetical protein